MYKRVRGESNESSAEQADGRGETVTGASNETAAQELPRPGDNAPQLDTSGNAVNGLVDARDAIADLLRHRGSESTEYGVGHDAEFNAARGDLDAHAEAAPVHRNPHRGNDGGDERSNGEDERSSYSMIADAQAGDMAALGVAVAVADATRRRLRGKQPPTGATCGAPARSEMQSDRTVNEICTPREGAPWVSRLVSTVKYLSAECSGCQSANTRTRCRGCSRPLCVSCAKHYWHCKVSEC